ncbi:chemotaxis protein histidine kinase CheA [Pseudomonas fluvialis]|uniref:Chemotaxis protein histidine kinase CheA n=1 Tax=Pseudomonas fluvialis TaxID=1793966 RepID=A0A7X0EQY6_9PSED|nr:hypothetical protein [Pseudomonas fluvialis]MBB6340772.1 chemotaxis protein histidine kinase CheA [Pseudomonas fluvialis]
MLSPRLRLLALALASLLGPVNGLADDYPEANLPVDPDVQALKQLEQSLTQGQMSQAESQLNALKQRLAGDTRLEQAQRQLSDGYLKQGEQAARQGDLAAAQQAAQQAQRLLPNNPKTAALQQSIEQAKAKQAAQLAAERQAAEQKAIAARAEQARQQQLAAQRQAAAKAAAKPQAQLIDPKASQTQIALPMLDTQDRDALRALMDKAAADVVTFRCAVQVQVRQAKDYPFVAALLSARVKKLDPAFKLQISQQLAAEQEPSLQLSPQPKS